MMWDGIVHRKASLYIATRHYRLYLRGVALS